MSSSIVIATTPTTHLIIILAPPTNTLITSNHHFNHHQSPLDHNCISQTIVDHNSIYLWSPIKPHFNHNWPPLRPPLTNTITISTLTYLTTTSLTSNHHVNQPLWQLSITTSFTSDHKFNHHRLLFSLPLQPPPLWPLEETRIH